MTKTDEDGGKKKQDSRNGRSEKAPVSVRTTVLTLFILTHVL